MTVGESHSQRYCNETRITSHILRQLVTTCNHLQLLSACQQLELIIGWLVLNDSTRDEDDTTFGEGHSRRYCNTGYDQSQGRRPSTLKCIDPVSKGDIEPNHPSEINPNSDSKQRSDGRSRRYCDTGTRVDHSLYVSRRETRITSHILQQLATTCNHLQLLSAPTA